MSSHGKRSLVGLVCVILAWLLVRRLMMGGIVVRVPQSDIVAARYSDELAHAPQHGSGGVAVSPDGRYAAFDTRAVRSYHTINVWDRWSESVTPVMSIQEIDPGSGSSHGFVWSADSRALLVSGTGSLPFRRPGKLCLVYVPGRALLHQVKPCE